MAVNESPDGTRSVRVEVEVAGPPERVWEAIATGPGISSWFVPTTVERGDDGAPTRVVHDFGPGMESVAAITAWDPPRALVMDSADLGEDAPTVASTWTVEPRADDGCLVRVEHALRADDDAYDTQLAAWESGWAAFFRNLQLALEHFCGAPSASFRVNASTGEPAAAWAMLAGGFGFEGAALGERFAAPEGPLALAGVVERCVEPTERVLRLERPTPGLVHVFVWPMGETAWVYARCIFFGAGAESTVEAERAKWEAWFAERFPETTDAPVDR